MGHSSHPIAQDIHPGRKISWDIRPTRSPRISILGVKFRGTFVPVGRISGNECNVKITLIGGHTIPDIQLEFVGENAAKSLELVQKLIGERLGTDSMIKSLTTLTLILAVPGMIKRPRGFFQWLQSSPHQDALINLFLHLQKDFNVDLKVTGADGQTLNLDAMSADDLRNLLSGTE